ncbi:hypothetical protein GGR51DRAFT_577225 [Nemania sp. FL0031]|nr:hypothetical protein GGR51DRAFT_577225 [Nemania sp. FL0031]
MEFLNPKRWYKSNDDHGEKSVATRSAPEKQSRAIEDNDGVENHTRIKILYDPAEKGLESEVDIVFIHGLGGHREATWAAEEPQTGRSVLWIEDFLPTELPRARIMTFGYSSQIFSVNYLIQRILYSRSQTLLKDLKHCRQGEGASNRPLIFISHGLGGLVVKSALIFADREEQVFRDIRLSTAGVVFFGTPHQGTLDTSWISIMSDLIRPMIDLDGMRDTLHSDLDWLQTQLEQYKSLEGNFPTYSIYEDEIFHLDSRDPTALPCVVTTPLELLNMRSLLSTFPRRQRHENLCRFNSRDSEYFEAMEKLVAIYKGSVDRVAENFLLDKLRRSVEDPSIANDDEKSFRIPISLPRGRMNPLVGRDSELNTIHNCLNLQNNTHLITLLGPHGIGKTRMALEYAYKYENQYQSIFWVDARSRFTLHSSLLKIAEDLNGHYAQSAGNEERLQALHHLFLRGLIDEDGRVQSCQDFPELLFLPFRKWLECRGNDRWLVIVDGADREADLRELHIHDFLNSPINGRVIVTSRALRFGATLEVQNLGEDDAMTLLRKIAWLRGKQNSDMLNLVNQLGRLPLAIKQAGVFLLRSKCPVSEFLEDISSDPLLQSRTTPESSLSPLRIIWSMSIQQLDVGTEELLVTIAFLSDNDMSVDFIKSIIKTLYGPKRALRVDQDLQTLEKYSLVRHDPTATVVALDSSMARWLRKSKQVHWDAEYKFRARMSCVSVVSYLTAMLAGVDPATYTPKQFRLEEQLLPYIERCVDYIQVLSAKDADWEVLGNVCRMQGRHDLAKQYYEIAANSNKLNPLRAEVLLGDMHQIERALGPAHTRTLGSAVLLASQLGKEGKHAKAEIIWRRVYSSQSKIHGDFHLPTLKTGLRLARIMRQQGKYGQAKALYSSTCNATARLMGEGHPDTLELMVEVAVLCTLERRFDEADQEYRKVLGKMEIKLGKSHKDVDKVRKYIELNDQERRMYLERVKISEPFTALRLADQPHSICFT